MISASFGESSEPERVRSQALGLAAEMADTGFLRGPDQEKWARACAFFLQVAARDIDFTNEQLLQLFSIEIPDPPNVRSSRKATVFERLCNEPALWTALNPVAVYRV